ncbi:MAG: histidinol-phosphate transaminase [Lachnospiraceae bacterium]
MRSYEDNIRKVDPYVPGEQPQRKVIKLNTNENPYPPSPNVQIAMDSMQMENLRLYPDPTAGLLVDELARYYGVSSNQVFVGVGSDDVLSMCFLTFFNSLKPIFFPDITYAFYKVWAKLYGIPYECKKLDAKFRLIKEDYYEENGGIIFPNPNAPTGLYETLDTVEDIVRHNPNVIIIIDEAYIDFAGPSAIELLEKYENLLVVQTFSKSRSMAGMRIGYAIGNPRLIQYLNDAKYSFNSYTMNQTSLVTGTESVKDKVYFDEVIQKILDTREWTKVELKKLGFEFPDAKTNFIFATHPRYQAKDLYLMLREQDIYVRYWENERIEQYIRITIGTKEQMIQLLTCLKNYIK